MNGNESIKKDTKAGIKTFFGSEAFSLTKQTKTEKREEETMTLKVNPD